MHPHEDPETWAAAIRSGDRTLLSRGITLLESNLPADREKAAALLSFCPSFTELQAWRIGITGAPGVGKSTFIDALGQIWASEGIPVAVLAVDPSSRQTRGSILGDKTRMGDLARHPLAFIRPSPSGDTAGGVHRKTRESILLCELAGFRRILIETVGTGQHETRASEMVDFLMLLQMPGGGDELQGIKRGIMELADMVVVNKADGATLEIAAETAAAYRQALRFFPPRRSQWEPPVLTCSAWEKTGFLEIIAHLETFYTTGTGQEELLKNRSTQIVFWMDQLVEERLREDFFAMQATREKYLFLKGLLARGEITPVGALYQLFNP